MHKKSTTQEKLKRIHSDSRAPPAICSFNFIWWVCYWCRLLPSAGLTYRCRWAMKGIWSLLANTVSTLKRPVTHHVVQVIKSIQEKFALVLRQSHVLQPIANGLVQQPAGSACWQGEALQQGETFEAVAAALWRGDVALPHHPRPTEPSAPATGRGGRQRPPWTGGQLPQGGGGWTTLAQDRFQGRWCQGWWGQ